jgi:hypothetical protein
MSATAWSAASWCWCKSPASLDPGPAPDFNDCNADNRGRDAAGRALVVCRWGDYAGASPDPANADVVSGTGMYIGDDRRYRSRNYALRATGWV